jgi:hypothetical protein
MSTPPTKLTARHARALAEADARYKETKRDFEQARADRDELRNRLRSAVDLDAPIVAGGYRILVKEVKTAASFRIGQFLEKHGKLTKAMEPFFTPGGTREDWRIDALPQRAAKPKAREREPVAA